MDIELLKYFLSKSYRSFSQNGEDLLLNKFFKGKEKGFYIEVGSYHPIIIKDKLVDIIIPGESPWKFEVAASKRAEKYKCCCLVEDPNKNYVHGPITYLCTAITKGIWMMDALKLAKNENLQLDTSFRPIESLFSYLKRKVYIASPFFIRKIIDFMEKSIKKMFFTVML